MSSKNVSLEPSEGPTIRNPTAEQIRAMLCRIGNGLDHCILDLGVEIGFVQAAGAANRLSVQYRDTSGMFESARSDLDVASVERVFVEALGGRAAWKKELTFRPMEDAPAGATGSPQGNDLVDAAKRAAKTGISRLAKGGLRGLFGGKS